MKRILRSTLIIIIVGITLSLYSCQSRTFYCLSDNRCITVWKKWGGECYVIPGKYSDITKPSGSYIRTTNGSSLDVIWIASDSILIASDEGTQIFNKVKDTMIIVNYNAMKQHNDSLYTVFDGRYPRYKDGINYISIDIKEGYARDGTGKILR